MTRINIIKFFLLSQVLSLLLGTNGFVLKHAHQREKRDLLSLLRGSDSLVSASDVNPLDVIPIPLKIDVSGDQSNFFGDDGELDESEDEQDDFFEELDSSESEFNADTFDQKLNNLKMMYETAISNLRTETIGAQTYIQKKTSLAEQHLENILKGVELMVNNRVDLSFHSIETKMNEAEKLLNALNALVLKNLETKLKSLEGDMFDQVKQEKTALENKMNMFNQKVEMLSEKLTQLVTGRFKASNRSLDIDTTNETTIQVETSTVPLTTTVSVNESLENEDLSTEDILDYQTESENKLEETTNGQVNDNAGDAIETTQIVEKNNTLANEENEVAGDGETDAPTDEEYDIEVVEESQAPMESEVVLNAWRNPVFHYEEPEYVDYSEINSDLVHDYYQDAYPVHYDYNYGYRHY